MGNHIGKIQADTINLIQSSSLFGKYTKDINNNELKLSYDFDTSSPPFPNRTLLRSEIINILSEDININSTFYNIKGEIGTGKTQLCNQIAHTLNKNIFWFRIRDYSHNLKNLILEISKTINKNSFNPLKLFFKELNIPKNSIIVLDDLPNLSNLDVNNEFKKFFDICVKNNILIISTSNYEIPYHILKYLNVKYINYNIPSFSEDETLELMKLYQCPKKLLVYAKLINLFNDSHPSFIIATVNYCVSKKWKINFEKFLSNKFIDDEIKNFQLILKETIQEEDVRELAYRLNVIGRTVTDNDIKLVCSIKPIIKFPYEKINQLLDIWIYKESEKEYLISPILYKLGVKNLDTEIYKKINISLGENIIKKRTLDQYDVSKGLLYFISAEQYDRAGYLLVRALFSIVNDKDVKENDISFIHYIWGETPFPKEMDTELKILIKGLQVIVQHKFGNDTKSLYKEFLELEQILDIKHQYKLLLSYSLFSMHKYPVKGIGLKMLNLTKSIPDEIRSSFKLVDKNISVTLNDFYILNLEVINSYDSLEDWLQVVENYRNSELEKLFKKDFGIDIDFYNLLVNAINNNIIKKIDNNQTKDIYNLLNSFVNNIYKQKLFKLWESIITLLIVCLLKLEKYDDAIILKDKCLLTRNNKSFNLLINNKIALKFVDIKEYGNAIFLFKKFLNVNIDNIEIANMYYYAAISYANLNDYLNASKYFKKVLNIDISIIDELYRASVLGEYSILLWENNKSIECINTCKEIYHLIGKQKKFTDQWKTIYLILGNHIAYFSTKLLNSSALKLTIPKSRSYEYTSPNKELLNLYDKKKECFFFYHFYNIYSFLKDDKNTIYFLDKSFENIANIDEYNYLTSFISFDYYSYYLDEVKYLKEVFIFSKRIENIFVLYFLPYIIRLVIENDLKRMIAFKNEFLKIFNNKVIAQQYIDSIVYVIDGLTNQLNYSKEKGDWITNRFELIYELTKCNLIKAVEYHTKLNVEFFTGKYENIFSELQKNMILEKYFFSYWVDKLNNEKDSFRYVNIVKNEVLNVHKINEPSYNKVTRLLTLINNYLIK